MDLRLHLDRLRPPAGWIEPDGSVQGARQAFDGWIGLLRTLSLALGEEADDTPSFRSDGGEDRSSRV